MHPAPIRHSGRGAQAGAEPTGGVHKQGLNLAGFFGRQSGQAESYSYSSANKKSGILWGDETLFDYLEDPKKYMKVRGRPALSIGGR